MIIEVTSRRDDDPGQLPCSKQPEGTHADPNVPSAVVVGYSEVIDVLNLSKHSSETQPFGFGFGLHISEVRLAHSLTHLLAAEQTLRHVPMPPCPARFARFWLRTLQDRCPINFVPFPPIQRRRVNSSGCGGHISSVCRPNTRTRARVPYVRLSCIVSQKCGIAEHLSRETVVASRTLVTPNTRHPEHLA